MLCKLCYATNVLCKLMHAQDKKEQSVGEPYFLFALPIAHFRHSVTIKQFNTMASL